METNAASRSSGRRASMNRICAFIARAATSISCRMFCAVSSPKPPGCQRTAIRLACGTIALSSSMRLATSPAARVVTPVMFPPGRARLATRSLPTGSATKVKTMGMVVVACLAARAASVVNVTMTSGLSRTSSAASAGSSSSRPAAQRWSTTRLCPSTQPSSRSPRNTSMVGFGPAARDSVPRRAVFAGCASEASGAARSAAPVPARNVRRSINAPFGPIEPPSFPMAQLLGQAPRNVLPYLTPCLRRPREAADVSEGHGDLQPWQVACSLRAGRERIRAWGNGFMPEPSLQAGRSLAERSNKRAGYVPRAAVKQSRAGHPPSLCKHLQEDCYLSLLLPWSGWAISAPHSHVIHTRHPRRQNPGRRSADAPEGRHRGRPRDSS